MKAVIILLLLPLVVAITEEEFKDLAEDLGSSEQASMVQGERINVYIADDEFHLVLEDGVDAGTGLIDDPTYNAFSEHAVMDQIVDGKLTVAEAIENKQITYEGVGFMNSIKSGVSKVVMKFMSWFS